MPLQLFQCKVCPKAFQLTTSHKHKSKCPRCLHKYQAYRKRVRNTTTTRNYTPEAVSKFANYLEYFN